MPPPLPPHKSFDCTLTNTMEEAQILQGFSYRVCSIILQIFTTWIFDGSLMDL